MNRSIATRRIGALLLLTGLIGSWAEPALAQRRPRTPQAPPAEDPRVVEARQAYDEGRRQFEARNFAEALRRFERAYELRPTAVILIAIANCHEQLGQFRDAVAALERYLRERSNAPDRAEIERRIAMLRPRAEQQNTGSSTANSASAASNSATSTAASGGTAASASNAASSTASASNDGSASAASAAGASSNNGAADNTATGTPSEPASADGAAASAEAPPPPSRGISPAVWVCAALAGAGVAGGSVLGFLALGEHATYNTSPSREVKDRGELFALTADLAFATAVLSGFVGTVVFLSDRAEAEREARAASALAPHVRSRRALVTRVRPVPMGLAVNW